MVDEGLRQIVWGKELGTIGTRAMQRRGKVVRRMT